MSLEESSADTDKFSDAEIMARTVYGEARGEGTQGWVAVAWVIKNRVDHPGWWGRSIRDVCLKPSQFSCWNFGDPNRTKILNLPDGDPLLNEIRVVVGDVLAGDISDPTGGSQFYHTEAVRASWDSEMVQTAQIGHHVFYKPA